jgi:hypothetical protein
MVAHKLLELRASAVCDLYELKPQARHQWVRAFLDALIDAPKELWRPTIIVLDEAHQFSPEGKSGESEASGSVVDLCTRGRKRGFCAVLATQRLGKLRKDAAAELLNVMVGMTFIDIDRERAGECLGISRDEKKEFNDSVKLLDPGQFYCLGRAICKERTLIKVSSVETTHPEAGGGKFSMAPPPAPEVVKAMMPKLADLPKAAEEKAQTESQLRSKIRELESDLKKAGNITKIVESKIEKVPMLTGPERKRLTQLIEEFSRLTASIESVNEKIEYIDIPSLGAGIHFIREAMTEKISAALPPRAQAIKTVIANPTRAISSAQFVTRPVPPMSDSDSRLENRFPNKCERAILSVLAQFPDGRNASQVATLSVYSKKSSGFTNALSWLRVRGYITRNQPMTITDEGLTILGTYTPAPTGGALRDLWISKLGKCEREILKSLIAIYPNGMSSTDLAGITQYSITSSGFTNSLSKLRTLELISRGQPIYASSDLFE